jgi:hypothetical protein
MNSIQLRFLYFLLGCIPSRLLLVWVAKHHANSTTERVMLSMITMVVGGAFLFLFVTGYRSTGPEVFGGEIWWKQIRIIHALLYLMYAYSLMADKHSSNAWMILLFDVIVGLSSFLVYHYKMSNFMMLF